MKRTLIALAFSMAPAVAVAQSVTLAGGARTTSSAPERPRLSAEAHARIEARMAAAAERGLPVAPMRSLAAEGEARFASETRIMVALSRLEANMLGVKRAFAQAGRTPSNSEVVTGAEAISQGATEAQLEGLVRHAPKGRSLEIAFATLSAFAARGEGVAEAAAHIEAKLAARASDASIEALVGGTVSGSVPVHGGLTSAARAHGSVPVIGSVVQGTAGVRRP